MSHPPAVLDDINVDQIATVTDRLLLGGGVRKRRPPTPRSAYGAQHDEATQFIRRPFLPKNTRHTRLAATAAIVAATAGFAITLLCIFA